MRGRRCCRRGCLREALKRTAVGAYQTFLCAPCHAELERAAKLYGGYSAVKNPRPAAWGWHLTPEDAWVAGGGMEAS